MSNPLTIQLTPEQIEKIEDYLTRHDLPEPLFERLALKVFRRREHIDPFPVLKKAMKQLARQHCIPKDYVLKELSE
jgi:hypothetical protein